MISSLLGGQLCVGRYHGDAAVVGKRVHDVCEQGVDLSGDLLCGSGRRHQIWDPAALCRGRGLEEGREGFQFFLMSRGGCDS